MVYKSLRQYQFSARVFSWCMVMLSVLLIAWIISSFFQPPLVDEPEKTKRPSPKSPKIVREIIMKVTPVENVPGEYILEYNNGYVEILHADGTRQPMIFTDESQVEKVMNDL